MYLEEDLTTVDVSEELEQSGVKRRSGRYAWGSGENPYQHEDWFASERARMKSEGLSDKEIMNIMGFRTPEYRAMVQITSSKERLARTAQVYKMNSEGRSNVAIAKELGISEGMVRNILKNRVDAKRTKVERVSDVLKRNADEKGMIDISEGVNREIEFYGGDSGLKGVSQELTEAATLSLLKEGYTVQKFYINQATNPGQQTNILVLCKPGVTREYVKDHMNEIKNVGEYSTDNGETFRKWEYPESIDSSRVYIRYADDNSSGYSGEDYDGVIQLRRGVEDISLGESSYAQVRIAVDGDKYMKGMAVYSDDIPKGFDIVYNTNKTSDKPAEKVFKPMKRTMAEGDDPKDASKYSGPIDIQNPFGSALRETGAQRHYIGEDGEEHLSPINKMREEGDWNEWSRTLSSQFLSKQPNELIERQLKQTVEERTSEFEDILTVQDPAVKRKMLQDFADGADSSAVLLKASPIKGQKMQVILPVPDMPENQCFAPGFSNGEKVALIRYPHAGTFEIPILTVNNKHPSAVQNIGTNTKDAIGISKLVADGLSGADFDGDTVLCIPMTSSRTNIDSTWNLRKTNEAFKSLANFDPKALYPERSGMKLMTSEAQKGLEMGKISNLINDMNLQGAPPEDLVRAVKHSMVVIDSKKHRLDYEASYAENGIADLKKKYQGKVNAGASSLISKAKSPYQEPEREDGAYIDIYDKKTGKTHKEYRLWDPETGEKLYTYTGRTYIDKHGKEQLAVKEIPKMEKAKDAYELSSGSYKESLYADFANSMKSLGNKARLEIDKIEKKNVNKEAALKFVKEIQELKNAVIFADLNKPRERQAQIYANYKKRQFRTTNKNEWDQLTAEERGKWMAKALAEGRARSGAKRTPHYITDKQWEAIQAGAISSSILSTILPVCDSDRLKELALPHGKTTLSENKQSYIRTLIANGYTMKEVAEQLDISTSTVEKYM